MDGLIHPVELNRETVEALDQIRSGAENVLYGASAADAEEKLHRVVLPLLEGSSLPNLQVMHYRWFLRELARLWRTRRDRDLAFHLELCIRKWVHLGLEPRTLQFFVCEAHQRLKAPNLTTTNDAKDGDITGLSDNADRAPSPRLTASGVKTEADPAANAQSGEEADGPAAATPGDRR